MTESVTALPDDKVAAILADLVPAAAGCGCRRELLPLLREDAPIYRGRSTTEIERLRAFVMAGIARAGLADELMPYVIEELETGTSPYTIAAAARAARDASLLPEKTAEFLLGAIDRIRHLDEYVHLDIYPAPPGTGHTTAIAEAIKTLAVAGSSGRAAIKSLFDRSADGGYFSPSILTLLEAALDENKEPHASYDCCEHGAKAIGAEPQPVAQSTASLSQIELQNQDGIRASFGQIFGGRTSVIVFFYTRCMNPDKCSRSIGQLARLHRLIGQNLAESTAMVAGITYDPEYDLPERLHRYGVDRGMCFGDRCQLFRSTGPFALIRDGLQLGVGYGSSTVNRHRIELIIVDSAGRIVESNVRRLWDAHEVADTLATVETNEVDF
jgi:cytochrome oxidase Cu insertion factor (SCO1/SenC/PrrC family)